MDITTLGKYAKAASRSLALTGTETRRAALIAIAEALTENEALLISENAADVSAARDSGMSESLLDRLTLTHARILGIAQGAREAASLPDPLNRVLSDITRPNSLHIVKVSVPLGVIGVIFEARPNVTADSAVLCLMSGNACVLRGGREAIRSNTAIANVIRRAISAPGVGMDENCVQLVQDTSRESASAMMTLNGYIDVLIPRGGRGLIQAVVKNATVPVIETGAGVCHAYIHCPADIGMAVSIVINAKASRPSVCNALECVLVDESMRDTFLPALAPALISAGITLHGDEATRARIPDAIPATQDDWGHEYGDLNLACRVVKDMDEAIAHVTQYGTGHSECIITDDDAAAASYMARVDAAAVYHNASTRFTDGGEFGLGAEIGISTQKLHARGPLGLNELTGVKYMLYGNGQVR